MKKIKTITAFVLILFFYSCTDPIPTQLIHDELNGDDGYQIEILSPEPEQNVYANGYDSTGIVKPLTNIASVISISHVKNSSINKVQYFSSASAIFFDTTKTIRSFHGKVVGYKTRYLGKVSFNGDSALALPFRIKFKEFGNKKDTLAGIMYYLFEKSLSPIGNHFLPFGTKVQFELKSIFSERRFFINVPEEISGNIITSGKREITIYAFT